MAHERVNITVDAELLATQIDASYKAYDDRPLSEVDEWGDLESFREAARSS